MWRDNALLLDVLLVAIKIRKFKMLIEMGFLGNQNINNLSYCIT